MAKGDVAVSMTLPLEIDALIERLSRKKKVTRRVIVIQAIKMLSEVK